MNVGKELRSACGFENKHSEPIALQKDSRRQNLKNCFDMGMIIVNFSSISAPK